jgi:hypothetical protein
MADDLMAQLERGSTQTDGKADSDFATGQKHKQGASL